MSEWIDFAVYVLEAIALWVAMPRWGTRMSWPMMRDRNPEWFDAHPEVIADASPGSWFLKACYGWCGLSILVLLTVQLGLQPSYFLPETLGMPDWKVLMSTNNLLIGIGLIGYFSGVSVFLRWMSRTLPLSERRQATLRPRAARDYVPRWSILLVNVVIAAHLFAWLYIGVAELYHTTRYWWAFAGMVGMTVLVYMAGRATIYRRPDHLDRTPGAVYRRFEVYLGLVMQLCLTALGVTVLYRELYDIPVHSLNQRYVVCLFSLFFAAFIFVMTRKPFGPGTNGSQPPLAANRST